MKKLPFLFYSLIALLVLYPLLQKGFILTLDMVFVPKPKINLDIILQSSLIDSLIRCVSLFIPNWIIQKIILFLIFFLSGISMHRLIPSKSNLPKYFGGVLYAVNPFVYERFMAGQIMILLAYAIFPFAIKYLIGLMDRGGTKNILLTVIWMSLIAMLDIRFLIFFFILSGFFLITKKKTFKKIFFVIILFIFLNLYLSWVLFPYYKQIINSRISLNELQAFATYPKFNLGVLFNVIGMYGFWKEPEFLLPKDTLPFWRIFPLALIGLSIYGFIYLVKDKNKRIYAIGLLCTWCISLILACGISLYPIKRQILFLYQKIPLTYIFREPQKFVSLMVFGYAYLGGMGLQAGIDKLRVAKKTKKIFIYSFLVLLFVSLPIYTHTIWLGLHGQIKPSHYPLSWYKVNELLNRDKQNFKVLFLPWHMYMAFDFTDNRIIVNPAGEFFNKPVILSNDPEFEGVSSSIQGRELLYIRELLKNKRNEFKFGGQIKTLNIKYIILSKNADYKKYDFLYNQNDLETCYVADDIVLFRNLEYVPKEEPESVIK